MGAGRGQEADWLGQEINRGRLPEIRGYGPSGKIIYAPGAAISILSCIGRRTASPYFVRQYRGRRVWGGRRRGERGG